ncbi:MULTISPECIES: putative solute-binding protein [Acinetobacter]|uniref:putative solute-binding protein n=1 Tax=Acinetobacter TaxID=469 RepID=UPI000C42ED76|nr:MULTISPECIES: putative solute-binding protein [Acinetobacter]MBC69647.1 RND transporter [Acinetobacter sp.]MBT51638.1 RND transporter [Acinetobacter sp.]HIQ34692.1 RND transporter [Acinetobacter venetianus]HJP47945.1 putative solute-binding protein [Acinetobacter venetianus]
MKKGLFVLSVLASMGLMNQVQAKQTVCVFDLLGKAGDTFKVTEEWAVMAKSWQADIRLIPYQDEAKAQNDFDAGRCDAVYMTSMRARKYNRFAGSIDAIGGVTSNHVAQKAISFALDKRNKRRLLATVDNQKYEVAGILQFGLAYVFVHDRNLNTIEKAKGKKFAYLHYDVAQKVIVDSLEMVSVPSEISDFVKKFNSNQVDVIAAPAYAYKPLEIERGIASGGAMFSFPVVNITGDLIIRPEKFPTNFGIRSREWFVTQLPKSFAMVKRLENEIPAKYKLKLPKEDEVRYQQILRDGRISLTKQGVYDPIMMSVLKRARCTIERTSFECSLGGE